MPEETNDIKIETLTEVPQVRDWEGAVLCFGEVMIRLSLPGDTSWLHEQVLHANLAGAECNVAVALAKWGIPAGYCTALPKNAASADILTFLREKNIDTSSVHFSGSRVGIMYAMRGSDAREGGVLYDRRYSAFGELMPGDINWGEVLRGVSWFHFTAISPALGENTAAVCKEAVMAARRLGIIVSIDLNHRPTLWQYGKNPAEVVPGLAEYCDVIMGNIWSAHTLLGISLDERLVAADTKDSFLEHAEKTAAAIQEKFAQCKTTALTFRLNTQPAGIRYYGCLFAGSRLYASREFTAPVIADKIGSGDCFMAGLIFALRNGFVLQAAIEFAAAAAFGKLQEKGDFTNNSVENINHIITNHGRSI